MTVKALHIINDLEALGKMLYDGRVPIEMVRKCLRAVWEMHTRFTAEHNYEDGEAIVVHDALFGVSKGLAVDICKLNEFSECQHCLDCKAKEVEIEYYI